MPMPNALRKRSRVSGSRSALPRASHPRVLLATDRPMLLDMFHRWLAPEFGITATATEAALIALAAQRAAFDVALIAPVSPSEEWLDAGRALQRAAPHARLVFLTLETDELFAEKVFDIGASAYLSMAGPAEELSRALRIVVAGERYLTPALAGGDIEELMRERVTDALTNLSGRELQVLRLVAAGQPMKTVARRLGIAPRTVAFHKYRAMTALDLHGTPDLIRFAVRHGLLPQEAGKPTPAGTAAE